MSIFFFNKQGLTSSETNSLIKELSEIDNPIKLGEFKEKLSELQINFFHQDRFKAIDDLKPVWTLFNLKNNEFSLLMDKYGLSAAWWRKIPISNNTEHCWVGYTKKYFPDYIHCNLSDEEILYIYKNENN